MEQEVKYEVQEVCRICEATENLIDISKGIFDNLKVKLHKIASVEEKYVYCLKYICTSCTVKLENAFDFITQCEFTYRKLLDQLESRDFLNVSQTKSETPDFEAEETKIYSFEAFELLPKEDPSVSPSPGSSFKAEIVESQESNAENKEIIDIKKEEDTASEDNSFGNETEPKKAQVLENNAKELNPAEKTKNEAPTPQKKKRNRQKMPKNLTCAFCEQKFSLKRGILAHLLAFHVNKNHHKCNLCGKVLIDKNKLKSHRENMHGCFKCNFCDKTFTRRKFLNRHQGIIHLGTVKRLPKKDYICDICGRVFKTHVNFTAHMNKHKGVRPHKCNVCGKDFVYRSAMIGHLKIHTDKAMFRCQYCSKDFKTNGELKKHIWVHIKTNKFTAADGTVPKSSRELYSCPLCPRTYKTKKALTMHDRTHTGERPYQCTLCPKTYPIKSRLTIHMASHRGERKFKCSHCSKTYGRRDCLYRHARICSAKEVKSVKDVKEK